jgi:phosphate transport system permease protein
MAVWLLVICVLGAMGAAYTLGLKRSLSLAGVAGRASPSGGARYSGRVMHSLPEHHGILLALWCGLPALVVLALWTAFERPLLGLLLRAELPAEMRELSEGQHSLLMNEIARAGAGQAGHFSPAVREAAAHLSELQHNSSLGMTGLVLALGVGATALAVRRIRPDLRARNQVEKAFTVLLGLSSGVAILTTIGIVLSVLFEAMRFFQTVPFFDFLFGLEWSPQTAIRSDQVGASGSFGAVPLFAGTFLISAIAIGVGAPLGLFSAIYLAEYAPARQRAIAKPMLEILAGIPTVVYGFFAALTVAPFLRGIGASLGLSVSSESALAAGTVMGIMLIPFVSSLSDDVIAAVPQALRDGSYAVGATRSETIRKVVLPAALPGIVGALLLAISRAIGETMIVVMAAGLSAKLTANPFDAVTTVTVQIVTLLVGDQEFDSPKTLAAFALGLVLFAMTLTLNVIAIQVVRRYREQYE